MKKSRKAFALFALLLSIVVNSSCAENSQLQTERTAWDSTMKENTVEAYLIFAHEFPKSKHIQVSKGTVRGRLWCKFNDRSVNGVLVTVEGTELLRNVSLKEAKTQAVISAKPASKGDEAMDTNGQTFNWTCFEATSGGLVIGDEVIAPKDSKNATVITSGDGNTLLAWDLKNAEPVAQPSEKPTYIEAEANKAWLPKP